MRFGVKLIQNCSVDFGLNLARQFKHPNFIIKKKVLVIINLLTKKQFWLTVPQLNKEY